MSRVIRADAVPTSRAACRFALLSPCGHGNLGDAAIQEAVLENLRRRVPHATFVGITLRPLDTERRHGIPAYPIGARSLPGYGIVPKNRDPDARAAQSGARGRVDVVSPPPRRSRLRSCIAGVARALVPSGALGMIRRELDHVRGAVAVLKQVDTLIVSGGGQLDDYWGGPWGHPYALAKWTLLARLLGRRVVVLSVGFGTLESRASRLLTRAALRWAHYRSYRDEGSRRRMRDVGFRLADADPVLPDLAFSLTRGPTKQGPASRRVGISPMAYCDPRVWPRKDAAAYETHLHRLAEVTVGLAEKGYRVSLLASDGPDRRSVQELLELVKPRLGDELLPDVPPSETVEEFMRAASDLDIVVASRLHGVVLSQLAGTPVVALSYDRKVVDLMRELGQERYCLDIERSDVPEIRAALDALESRLEIERSTVRERLAGFRRELDSQYDLVAASQ